MGRYQISVCWVVICYASDVIKYDRRAPALSNAPLHITQDTLHQHTSIEKKTD